MMNSENATTEFKREYTGDIRKEVVAFANSQGGVIYIGIDDDGTVTGLANPDYTLQQVSNMIRDSIKPDITMFTHYDIQKRNEKQIVAVTVQRGTDRPYYIAEKGLKPSGVYVRMGSSSAPASADAIRSMIKETDGDSFEAGRSLIQDLTFDYVKNHFLEKKLDLNERQMQNLGLIGSDELYSNLGLLLSEQCHHTIKVAVFQGNDKSVFKDRREFGGSLLKQLVNVYEYIDLHNKTKATFTGLKREDKRDYPEVALREALLNAIVHRDYSFSGSTLISIFDDRIEIVSLGGLVPGLSLDAIKIGASQSRNERLANIFYRLKLIEAYGTGITKIISSYAGEDTQPDFVAADGAFLTVLPNRNEHDGVKHTEADANNNAETVLAFLDEHGKISRSDAEKLFGIGQTQAGNILRKLEHDGLITRTGGGKKTRYCKA